MNEETEVVPELPDMTEVLLVSSDGVDDDQSSKCKIQTAEVPGDISDCSGSGNTVSTTLPITSDNIDGKEEMKYRQWMTMEFMTMYCVLIGEFLQPI